MDELMRQAREEVIGEVIEELGLARRYTPPHINDILSAVGKFPKEALLLGVPEGYPYADEYPVALNMTDGYPVLLVGDRGCGKLNLLQKVVAMADATHNSKHLEICVITPDCEAWRPLYCVDGFSAYSFGERAAEDALAQIAGFTRDSRRGDKITLLILDNLSRADELDYEARSNLSWILNKGKGVCTLASIDSNIRSDWTTLFKSHLWGRVENYDDIRDYRQPEGLDKMCQGRGFVMWDKRWVKFYAPRFQ